LARSKKDDSDGTGPALLSSDSEQRAVEELAGLLLAATQSPVVWVDLPQRFTAVRGAAAPYELGTGHGPTALNDGTPLIEIHREPIVTQDGQRWGSLVLFDVLRRSLGVHQLRVVSATARSLGAMLEATSSARGQSDDCASAVAALEHLPFGLIRLDAQARVRGANAAARKLMGLLGTLTAPVDEPGFAEPSRRALHDAMNAPEARLHGEVPVRTTRPTLIRSARLMPFGAGETRAAWVMLRVSRPRLAPSSRRRTTTGWMRPLTGSSAPTGFGVAPLWRALDTAGVGIFHWDLVADRVELDPVLVRLLDAGRSEFEGTLAAMESILEPVDPGNLRVSLGQALRSGNPVDDVVRVRLKDGRERLIRIWGRFAIDERGRPTSLSGTARQVNELEAPRPVDALVLVALDALTEGCIVLDAQANVCFANLPGTRAMGLQQRAIYGRNLWDILGDAHQSIFGLQVRRGLAGHASQFDDWFPIRNRLSACRIVPDAQGRGATLFFRDVTDEPSTKEGPSASNGELRELGRRVHEAQEAERRRIARELHDVMGQNLSIIKLRLQLLRKRLAKANTSAENLELCQAVIGDTDNALQATRKLAVELRPSVLDELGLHAALQWQAQDITKRTGIDVRVRFDAADQRPVEGRRSSSGRETVVFRAVQELLTNVIRHADARHVDIVLRERNGELSVEVRDDGKGFSEPNAERSSLGLLGVSERVHAYGGDVRIESKPGGGTQVRVVLPSTREATTEAQVEHPQR
jgi:signal transduction histidine kinase